MEDKLDYSVLSRRKGRFVISMDSLASHPDVVMEVMSQCIVTWAEMRYFDRCFHYEAISPQFDLVEEGGIGKTYVINVTPQVDPEGEPMGVSIQFVPAEKNIGFLGEITDLNQVIKFP